MTHTVIQKIGLDEKELDIIAKAKDILNKITDDLGEVSSFIVDEQIIPNQIEELIEASLLLECKKIYSMFNENEQKSIREYFSKDKIK